MTQSITIKPGTWVARSWYGIKTWIVCDTEFFFGAGDDHWNLVGNWTTFDSDLLDCSSFPTFNEPDWRKTKFQVQQSLLPCEVEFIQQVKDRGEIDELEDGFKYLFPRDGGGMAAWHLRAIADELDRQNSGWEKQIAKEMAKFQVGE